MDLQSVALHQNVNLREQCAKILNGEWPRSLGARLHMLEKSSDQLPYSLALVRMQSPHGSPEPEVIGHARLCKVHGNSNACFVESVVIAKKCRGQGYGRRLMEEAEQHARRLGLHTIYLTTHDKQDFYLHMGYNFCLPIISLGGASNLLSEKQFESLLGSLNLKSNFPDGDRPVISNSGKLICNSGSSDCSEPARLAASAAETPFPLKPPSPDVPSPPPPPPVSLLPSPQSVPLPLLPPPNVSLPPPPTVPNMPTPPPPPPNVSLPPPPTVPNMPTPPPPLSVPLPTLPPPPPLNVSLPPLPNMPMPPPQSRPLPPPPPPPPNVSLPQPPTIPKMSLPLQPQITQPSLRASAAHSRDVSITRLPSHKVHWMMKELT